MNEEIKEEVINEENESTEIIAEDEAISIEEDCEGFEEVEE